jgi:hypothetical protein
LIAVSQLVFPNEPVVHKRSIGRLKVLNPIESPIERDPRVMAARALLIDGEIILWRPTDLERGHPKPDPLA